MEWLSTNQIKIEPPKRPKKITGTRFASILGLDRWNTDFKTWCAITRTYEEPFVDNKYTIAGKVIEPKIVEYLRKVYRLDLKTPEDVYGKDCFKKTGGNFFPDGGIFGGMWDALSYDEAGKLNHIVEIKTTGRVEDWVNGAPDHYALQAALYAYLKGVDNVIMVCSFLEEKDYENPEDFVPSSDNTIIDVFRVSERYPQFQRHIDRATDWWTEHVESGISPPFDEKKDADILKELRKNNIDTDDDLMMLVAEAESLKAEIEKVKDSISDKEARFKELSEILKNHCIEQLRDGDTRVVITGPEYEWILTKSEGTDIDKKALAKDGLLEKYSKPKISYRFTQKSINKGD